MRMLIAISHDEPREFPFHTFQSAKALPFEYVVMLSALHAALCAAPAGTARV